MTQRAADTGIEIHFPPHLPDISDRVALLMQRKDASWAWLHFLDTVRDLIDETGARSVIEIGGGRSPSLTQEEVAERGIRYTSNDISARELSKAPDWVSTALFDVQTADKTVIEPFRNSYDLAFSRMVMEHVADYRRAYGNLYEILRPGGIAIAFHPVLFCAPFVVNKLLPERLSDAVLRSIFPNRVDEGTPKFPAVYSGCRIADRVRLTIRDFGFRNVWQVPFWGHSYYRRFPVVRDLHRHANRWIMDAEVKALASFAFTIVQK